MSDKPREQAPRFSTLQIAVASMVVAVIVVVLILIVRLAPSSGL